MAAIAATAISKSFDSLCALDGVDLGVEEGEVRGLLGPNGAGKTTLLRILFGLLPASAGTVELLGRRLDLSDPSALDGVAGFVEDPRFYPYLSGRANLELLAELDGGGAPGRVAEVLDRTALSARAADRVGGYSTGMKQRLGIAAALLREPRLVLVDEPTSGLDPAGARDVLELIRGLGCDGVAVLLSSHQIGELEGICDSFTVLRRGAVVWDGTAAALQAQAPAPAYRLQTSDDRRAFEVAERVDGVEATLAGDRGLTVTAGGQSLDRLTVALGREGVATRRLELLGSPLESMFFELTADELQVGVPAR